MSWHPSFAGAVLAFTPLDGLAAALGLTFIALTVVGFFWLPRLLDHRPWVVYLMCLGISWIPVQALALIFEGRRMWLPGAHSAVFFWGDSVLIPASVVALSVLRRRWYATSTTVAIADTRWWRAMSAVIATVIAIAYRANETVTMTQADLALPAKTWHDYFVYPVFAFLITSQLPFLWQSRWRTQATAILALTVIAGFAGWWVLGHWYDPSQVVEQRPLLGFA